MKPVQVQPAVQRAGAPDELLRLQRQYGNCYVLRKCGNDSMMAQRQEAFTAEAGAEVPKPAIGISPERLRKLAELQTRITTESAGGVNLRKQLDALQQSSLERSMLEDMLHASRETLIGLLEARINVLKQEITSLNVRIGPSPVSLPGRPETSRLGYELLRREQELRQHQQQLQPLKRWKMRRMIGSLTEQIAAVERELATLPQTCDPSDPTAELLLERKNELERRKQAMAKELTATATEYEQWDPRWGAKRYGKSSNCTNIKQAGCGPTSLAIVLNYLYQEDPEGLAARGNMEIVTPVETARYAETHGRVCNSGTAGDTMVTNVHTGWPGFHGQKITLNQATTQLRSGNSTFAP